MSDSKKLRFSKSPILKTLKKLCLPTYSTFWQFCWEISLGNKLPFVKFPNPQLLGKDFILIFCFWLNQSFTEKLRIFKTLRANHFLSKYFSNFKYCQFITGISTHSIYSQHCNSLNMWITLWSEFWSLKKVKINLFIELIIYRFYTVCF